MLNFELLNVWLIRNSVRSLCDGGQPRRGDRYLAWGVSPRNSAFHFSSSREAATDALLSTESERFCRPLQGLMLLLVRGSWGSRPRLSICRRFAAHLMEFRMNLTFERFNFQTFSRWNQYLDQQIPLSPMIMMLCLISWLQYGQTELDAALTYASG